MREGKLANWLFARKRFEKRWFSGNGGFTTERFCIKAPLKTDDFAEWWFCGTKILRENGSTEKWSFEKAILRKSNFAQKRFYKKALLLARDFARGRFHGREILNVGIFWGPPITRIHQKNKWKTSWLLNSSISLWIVSKIAVLFVLLFFFLLSSNTDSLYHQLFLLPWKGGKTYRINLSYRINTGRL